MGMNIETISSMVASLALVAAGIFAGLQIRQATRQRSREYAMQLLRSFQTPEFQLAIHFIVEFPEGLTKKEVEETLGEKTKCLFVMFGTFEALGALIHRGEIDIGLVEDFFSGVIIIAWRKFRNYIYEIRELGDRPTYYEWFQWLAEHIQLRESKEPVIPAHIEFKNWEP
jgi:ADP-dependent phosphofructokinase/glucokinase